MTATELEKIGKQLGLSFNEKDNYKDSLNKGIRVFNGANSQRILIDSNWNDSVIYTVLGESLKEFGRIERSMQINELLKPW